MQLAVSAAGIGCIQLAFKYACRGKAASADVGPPLHGQVRHVRGREDCLIGIYAVMRGVEAEMRPICSGDRRPRRDHGAKQHRCPDTTANRDPTSQTSFLGDYRADIVGQSMSDGLTDKANSNHSSWFSFDFAGAKLGPRVRGLGRRAEKFPFHSEKPLLNAPVFIMAHPLPAIENAVKALTLNKDCPLMYCAKSANLLREK